MEKSGSLKYDRHGEQEEMLKMPAGIVMFAAILLMLSCGGATAAAESVDWGVKEQYFQSRPEEQKKVDEYNNIKQAYLRVVKYYNKNLPDAQALKIASLLLFYADKFDLDPRLVVAVVAVESRFQPFAVSPKGAQGLGQLMPGTARMLGVNNAFDVNQNLYGTTRYLRIQLDRWGKKDNVLDLILASYNAGPEAVEKYKGIPPYNETRNYVVKVKKLYHFFVYGK